MFSNGSRGQSPTIVVSGVANAGVSVVGRAVDSTVQAIDSTVQAVDSSVVDSRENSAVGRCDNGGNAVGNSGNEGNAVSSTMIVGGGNNRSMDSMSVGGGIVLGISLRLSLSLGLTLAVVVAANSRAVDSMVQAVHSTVQAIDSTVQDATTLWPTPWW